ncbi:hypothetical protein [Naasia lichenicola]|uniref:Uncharacterized protein n=1 Tax=Naasia lichenicola TaxID=2565933 RepID=A0A4S4FT72_9MICO|nr:hypothetical protein [Naasia lichenicola]THG33528.1 hypothetical protein E6C64_04110 [Naasia lichenicola]
MLPVNGLQGLAQLPAAIAEFRAERRVLRAARAQQHELELMLRSYSSASDRAEMDAILGRYEESPTHRAWDAVTATS